MQSVKTPLHVSLLSAGQKSAGEPLVVEPSFSFAESIVKSIAAERYAPDDDVGPTDALSPEDLRREYESFFGFGLSPLSSPSPSPPPSRPSSPLPTPSAAHSKTICDPRTSTLTTRSSSSQAASRNYDAHFRVGSSPLSPPPPSLPSSPAGPPNSKSSPTTPAPTCTQISTPFAGLDGLPSTSALGPPSKKTLGKRKRSSRCSHPNTTTHPHTLPPSAPPPFAPPAPHCSEPIVPQPESRTGNSKNRRNKKKGHRHRLELRREARLHDSSAGRTPRPATVAKHVAPAEAVHTTFDAATFPTASTGFIALPDDW